MKIRLASALTVIICVNVVVPLGRPTPTTSAVCLAGTPASVSNNAVRETARTGTCGQNPNFYSGAYRSAAGGNAWVIYTNLPNGPVPAPITQSTSWQNAPTIQDDNANAPVRLCTGSSQFPQCSSSFSNTGF